MRRKQLGSPSVCFPVVAHLVSSSSPFEGIADTGVDVISWQDDPDDRVLGLLTRYNSGIGTRSAWHMHTDGWSTEAVREEMLRDSLSGGHSLKSIQMLGA